MPTLEITTMIGCPLRCTFCPQDKLAANYPADAVRALTSASFEIILEKVPQYVRIDFSGLSEPWANRHATNMLAWALFKKYNVAVYTTLQGMRDPDTVVAILKQYRERGQVERVVVHLPDASGNMRGFKLSADYLKALKAFQDADASRELEVGFMTMSDERWVDGEKLENTWVNMDWRPVTRAGNLNLQDIGDQKIEDEPRHETPLMCSYTPFYDHNVLLPNGDVVLCCMDYSLKHKLGNLLEDDYSSLFLSEEMSVLRMSNIGYNKTGGGSICRKCSRAKLLDVKPDRKQFWEERVYDVPRPEVDHSGGTRVPSG